MLNHYSYAMICNNDDNLYPTEEPTEIQKIYYKTNPPIFITTQPYSTLPTYNEMYPCICTSEKKELDNKFIIFIVATSITSFSCVILFCIIMWYRFFFKRKLLNKYPSSLIVLEDFGIKINDVKCENDINDVNDF